MATHLKICCMCLLCIARYLQIIQKLPMQFGYTCTLSERSNNIDILWRSIKMCVFKVSYYFFFRGPGEP